MPKVPNAISGVPVEQSGKPLEVKGQRWVTLIPVDDYDERIWEFCLDSGRIIQTKP